MRFVGRLGTGRLLAAAVFALGLVAPVAAAPAKKPAVRPNILLLIGDDWSFPHTGVYGDRMAKTPAFDKLAREGMLFTNAFVAAPSCTPSRAALLTGRYPHQLEEGGNLHGFLPRRFPVYPDMLEAAGYAVGLQGKGWAPGRFEPGGRTRNPAGPPVESFAAFIAALPADKPFAFWFGSTNPHRPYEPGSGRQAGYKPEKASVPPYWIDEPSTRADLIDYYLEVERFDNEVAEILAVLDKAGRREDTLVVMTSDNGMPFPRAKGTLYDAGSRVPLVIRWPAGKVRRTRTEAFVNLLDLAPTFLGAAGLVPPAEMAGRSLLPLLRTGRDRGRERVFLERERHAHARKGNLSYPSRAVRTSDFLYIRNLQPDRWPHGDPELVFSLGPFGDTDNSDTKTAVTGAPDSRAFALSLAKRPAEELYAVRRDRLQVDNLADKPAYAAIKKKLAAALDDWMKATSDPRVDPNDNRFEKFPFYGSPAPTLGQK